MWSRSQILDRCPWSAFIVDVASGANLINFFSFTMFQYFLWKVVYLAENFVANFYQTIQTQFTCQITDNDGLI